MSRIDKPLRSVSELLTAGLVRAEDAEALADVSARYAIAISPAMAALMAPGDSDDPIARQFVPDVRERDAAPGDRSDPLDEARLSPVPGLVHRYPDRVLLKLTHTCPVYCRFCFRRESVGPGGDAPLAGAGLDAAIAYIAARPQIWEVILTGGDPLVLSARRIEEVTRRLDAIGHVQVLRWHTRVPVVAPDLVDGDLVAALRATSQAVFVALHANHPREFTQAARAACARLIDSGIGMVSQTVLLKGINDEAGVLAELMRAFVALRIKPYYLHHADPAPGTGHLRTTIAEGQALMRALRGRLSGLAQPTYVLDIPGGHGKVPVGPGYLSQDGESVTDIVGGLHPAPDADRG